MATTRDVAISNLLLDQENPRLPSEPQSQVEAFEAMLRLDLDKVATLATDIAENGLDPSARLVVMPEKPGGRRFVVLEGNRRLTALRLLSNPAAVDGLVTSARQRRFVVLAQQFAANPVATVSCAVVDSRDQADHWIRNRHTGQRGGAGLVPWNSVEIARYDRKRHGKESAALTILELVRDHGNLDDKTLAELADFPLTNLDRLIDDKAIRKELGFEKVKEQIQTALPAEELLKPFTRMVRDIATGKVKVGTIDTAPLRASYLKTFKSTERPDLSQRGKSVRVLAPPGTRGRAVTSSSTGPARTPRPSSAERKRVFASSFVPNIPETRINNIYHEFHRLDIERHTNACSVLFRVFVELSVDVYLKRHSIGSAEQREGSFLRDKISMVANHMESNGTMTKEELLPVRRAQQEGHLLAATVKTMHQYVHNRHFSPSTADLRTAADNLERFLTAIWP